jgi:tetratricopeptide (TPR) repeat protein
MKRVSRVVAAFAVLWFIVLTGSSSGQNSAKRVAGGVEAARDPQKWFRAGEAALQGGRLDEAEHDFWQVLAIDPGASGAYTNLGVIAMRRMQWAQALDMLRKAEKLAPDMAGIRLNIGLVYYRQRDFQAAIAPFESVARQMPGSYQARYLLGFCYFFSSRWSDAVTTLEPLWEQVSAADQLNYLYVLGRAAEISKNTALEKKAYARMAEIGQGVPEFHMIVGKAHLNRGEYDDAIRELERAAQADPKLPLVHYYLGMTYVRKQDYQRARAEFQKDLALEPDAGFTYEQLGKVESTLQNERVAARDFERAVKLDPLLVESHMGLAEIEERNREYAAALAQLDEVIRLDKDAASARYLRGQVLLRMGREKEGREELALASKMLNERRAARHEELEGEPVSSPELRREPQ